MDESNDAIHSFKTIGSQLTRRTTILMKDMKNEIVFMVIHAKINKRFQLIANKLVRHRVDKFTGYDINF